MDIDLRNKRGLYWNHTWYPNKGTDHEHNVMELLYKFSKIYPNENWEWCEYKSPLDFFILKKKAIQIASGSKLDCIIASAAVYDLKSIEKFKEDHNLLGYVVYLIW